MDNLWITCGQVERILTGSGKEFIPKPLPREGKKEAGAPAPLPPLLGIVDKCLKSGSGEARTGHRGEMVLDLFWLFLGGVFHVLRPN